jgi:hypothetical protein
MVASKVLLSFFFFKKKKSQVNDRKILNILIGCTKDVEYRKEQLRGLIKFLKEHERGLCDVLYKDLHKHELEARCAEIAPIIGECEYMIKVSILSFFFR